MNKSDFIKKLAKKTGLDEKKCAEINNVIENNFIVGRKNKDKIISELISKINIDEKEANKIYSSAMEIIADDACQRDERTNHVVDIESDDESLQRFLQDFLTNNVNIEDRIWGWTFEVVKHGDLKLRRREYYAIFMRK